VRTRAPTWGNAARRDGDTPDMPKQIGFVPQRRLRWLSVGLLLHTAFQVVLSKKFGEFVDRRELQAIEPTDPVSLDIIDLSDRADLWVDYVSDPGDGFNAATAIASVVARTADLPIGTATVAPARLLVFGGDEAYPRGSRSEYQNRLAGPYRSMLNWVEPPRTVVALPGNHDWYDGLVSFIRQFCQYRWIGGWRTCQKRSYFSVKLPHGWWIWGVDIQLDADIDETQLAYFRDVATKLADGDAIILCWAKPSWVDAAAGDPQAYSQLEFFERTVIGDKGNVRVSLSGDRHHYARYEESRTGAQKITAGGGGAYLSATHHLPQRLELPPAELRDVNKRDPVHYEFRTACPAPERSRALATGILWRIFGNRTFYLVPAVVYLLLALLFDDARAALLAGRNGPLALGPLIVTALAVVAVLIGLHAFASDDGERRGARILAATGHFLLHASAVYFGVLVLGSPDAGWRAGIDPELASAAGIAVALGLVIVPLRCMRIFDRTRRAGPVLAWAGAAVVVLGLGTWWVTAATDQFVDLPARATIGLFAFVAGASVGTFLVACYLLVAGLADINTNELFSAQAIEDHKSFLALQVTDDALVIHPIALDHVPRHWERRTEGPWFVPAGGATVTPRLIEKPITVTRKPAPTS
jgi:hypothetical protein